MALVVTEESIIAALREMSKNDTQSIQAATNYLLNVMNDPNNMVIIFAMISKPYPDSSRQLCALFCRRMIFQFYKQFDLNSKNNIKSASLLFLKQEKNVLVKRAICGIVSAIAGFELENNEWPEVISSIESSYCSSEWQDRESAILIMYSLGSQVLKVMKPEAVNLVLLAGLQDSSYEVLSMTIKACCNIMLNLFLENQLSVIQPVVSACIDKLQVFYQNNDIDMLLLLMPCINDIINGKRFEVEDMLKALNICIQMMSNKDMINSVRNSAILYILYCVENYTDVLLKQNLHLGIIELTLRCLSDGVDESGEDDDESVSQTAEMLMDALGLRLPEEDVFQFVYSTASQWLTSSDWHDRRSALTFMLVIVEYTYDYFKPILQQLAPQVRVLLRDPIPAVRRKATFFFSETMDYCGVILREAAPFLIDDIQQMIQLPNEFDVTNGLYLLESCSSIYNEMTTEAVISSMDTVLHILTTATMLKTQSLALSCISSIIEVIGNKASERVPVCISIIKTILQQPINSESIDVRNHCVELLNEIIRFCGIDSVVNELPMFLSHFYSMVVDVNDLEYNSYIFPFVQVVTKRAIANPALYNQIRTQIEQFIPYFETIIFTLYEYSDVDLPTASTEFGKLDGPFSVPHTDSVYHVVRVDTRKVECKAAALDAYMSIKLSLLQTGSYDPLDQQEKLASTVISLCQHSNQTLRQHGIKALIVLLQIINECEKHELGLNHESNEPYVNIQSRTNAFSLVVVHLFRSLLEKEEEEEIAIEMFYVMEMFGITIGTTFYSLAVFDLFTMIKKAFEYNYPSEEDYIDGVTLDYTPDENPVVTKAISLLESIVSFYNELNGIPILSHIQQLWQLLRQQLVANTDSEYLAAILHFCSVLLEFIGDKAEFIVNDVMKILPCALEKQNEQCRAESCRCLGWLCSVFPTQMSASTNYVIECIVQAMQKRVGDSGEAVDLATGALNRILKNIMDSPKQALFINVLNSLPPTSNASEVPYVYKTLFDMYENKGEMFTQFATPLINAFIRSLMHGELLSEDIKKRITTCLLAMYNEDSQAFSSIVQTFSPDEIAFSTTLFSHLIGN